MTSNQEPAASPAQAEKPVRPSRRSNRQLPIVVGALGLIAVIAVVAFFATRSTGEKDLTTMPDNVVSYDYKAGQHDDAFNNWTESPPVGGKHNNVWQSCGYYDKAIPNGRAVHSLEHGAVWITYQPDLPADQIAVLKKLAEGSSYVLVSPYEGQSSPVIATSWNHQVALKSATSDDLIRFVNMFANSATYTPEFGARCVGGSSDPA